MIAETELSNGDSGGYLEEVDYPIPLGLRGGILDTEIFYMAARTTLLIPRTIWDLARPQTSRDQMRQEPAHISRPRPIKCHVSPHGALPVGRLVEIM